MNRAAFAPVALRELLSRKKWGEDYADKRCVRVLMIVDTLIGRDIKSGFYFKDVGILSNFIDDGGLAHPRVVAWSYLPTWQKTRKKSA